MQRCGAKTRSGGQCKQRAGWGTDHVGVGRCKLHGGATPVKHGLYSKYSRQRLADKIEASLDQEEKLLDLRQHVALQVAVIQNMLDAWDNDNLRSSQGKPYSPLTMAQTLSDMSEAIGRNLERLHKIEHGEQLTITVNGLNAVLQQVVMIIGEEVDDRDTRERIATRFRGIRI